jgi:hypothetical protein
MAVTPVRPPAATPAALSMYLARPPISTLPTAAERQVAAVTAGRHS